MLRLSSVSLPVRFPLIVIAAALAFALPSVAQMGQQSQQSQGASPSVNQVNSMSQQLQLLTDVQKQPGLKVDPREQAAYDNFFRVNSENLDKKIQLGNEFLQKYPASIFAEAVDSGLSDAYYAKEDWKSFYGAADRALALKPDDVDVLTTVGWVIPHIYDSSDPDADARLAKAETYEKHAIELLATMLKPASLTDAQFAAAKAQKAIQAHSALGLVYFRREDYANSMAELQQATQNNPNPDPTDLFVLGMDLQNLDKFGEAADVFGRCGQIAGNLQDRCKQNADMAKNQAAQPK
jgi:tetratricopeptide (TPR) repeat protein